MSDSSSASISFRSASSTSSLSCRPLSFLSRFASRVLGHLDLRALESACSRALSCCFSFNSLPVARARTSMVPYSAAPSTVGKALASGMERAIRTAPSCGLPKSDSSTYDGYATRPRKGASLRGPGICKGARLKTLETARLAGGGRQGHRSSCSFGNLHAAGLGGGEDRSRLRSAFGPVFVAHGRFVGHRGRGRGHSQHACGRSRLPVALTFPRSRGVAGAHPRRLGRPEDAKSGLTRIRTVSSSPSRVSRLRSVKRSSGLMRSGSPARTGSSSIATLPRIHGLKLTQLTWARRPLLRSHSPSSGRRLTGRVSGIFRHRTLTRSGHGSERGSR